MEIDRGQSRARFRACTIRASTPRATLHWNLGTAPHWSSMRSRNGEGLLAKDGPLVVKTGKHTGRSAKDKFIVRDAETESNDLVGQSTRR